MKQMTKPMVFEGGADMGHLSTFEDVEDFNLLLRFHGSRLIREAVKCYALHGRGVLTLFQGEESKEDAKPKVYMAYYSGEPEHEPEHDDPARATFDAVFAGAMESYDPTRQAVVSMRPRNNPKSRKPPWVAIMNIKGKQPATA
jgi:hypothetical protein